MTVGNDTRTAIGLYLVAPSYHFPTGRCGDASTGNGVRVRFCRQGWMEMAQKGEKDFWGNPIVQGIIYLLMLFGWISACTGTKHGHFNKDGDLTGVDSETADLY